MLRVVTGAAAAYAALLAAMLLVARDRVAPEALWDVRWVLIVLLVPVMGAWLGAEVVHWATPRRLLDRRAPRRVRQAVYGGVSAVIGASIVIGLVPFTPDAVPDPVQTGSGALAGAVIAGATLRRVRRGRCLACGYELAGLTGPPERVRCPECGRAPDPDELGIVGRSGSSIVREEAQ